MRLAGIALFLIGFGPLLTLLGAETLARLQPGCAANEAGALGCTLLGRDINGAMAHAFDPLPYLPLLLPLGFLGTGLLLWTWSHARATTRRARHR